MAKSEVENRLSKTSSVLAMVAIVTASGALSFAQPAAANTRTSGDVAARTVRFGDLDLTQERGAKELLSRVHIAARQVCMGSYEVWANYISIDPAYRNCVKTASARAVAALNNPNVTAMFSGEPAVQMADATSSH